MRAEGHAVESTVRVLCEQGVKISARAYRAWTKPRIADVEYAAAGWVV